MREAHRRVSSCSALVMAMVRLAACTTTDRLRGIFCSSWPDGSQEGNWQEDVLAECRGAVTRLMVL